MEQYLSSAELVIEGKVLDETFAIRNETSGSIETVHTILIDRVLKGNISFTSIEVHTPGGQLDDVIESVSHGSTLGGGQIGIFLLSSNSAGASLGNSTGGYHLHGGNAGKITPLKYDDDYEAIHWGELDKYKSWRQLREQVGASLGVDLSIHPLTAAELQAMTNNKEFCVKLDNPVPNVEDMTVEFDVMAKSSVPGLKFARAEVSIDYPTGNLGNFIVDQEKIEVEKGDVTNSPAYTVAVEDKSDDQIELSIESPCDNNEPHYVLDTVYEKLATLTVEVNEWGDLGTMNVDDFAVDGTAEFVNPATFQGTPGCTEFDDLCGEGEFEVNVCSINEVIVSDNAGGLGYKVIFKGENFGNKPEAKIFIPDADQAEANTRLEVKLADYPELFNWNDIQVEVEISSNYMKLDENSLIDDAPFGSGRWRLRPSGGVLGCNAPIDISYAVSNDYNDFMNLGQKIANYSPPKINGVAQAITIQIDENLISNLTVASNSPVTQSEAVTIIEQTVQKWSIPSGLQFDFEEVDVLTAIPDGTIRIFTEQLSGIVNGATSRTVTRAGICTSDRVGYEQKNARIRLNTNNAWYFGDNPSGVRNTNFDFQSILLHELGHALGFSHSMDPAGNGTADNRVMYHELKDGEHKRNIDYGHENGICIIRNLLENSNANGCFASKDVGLVGSSCTVSGVSETLKPQNVRAFYSVEDLYSYLSVRNSSGTRMYDALGRLTSYDFLTSYQDVNFTRGVYFITSRNSFEYENLILFVQ